MILHANKLKTIVSETTTALGTTSTDVLLETSVVALALYVTGCPAGCAIIVDIYEVGVNTSDDIKIASFPTVRKAETDPLHLTVESTGNLRIDVSYNDAITYEIRGKSLTTKPVSDILTVAADRDTQAYQEDVLVMLRSMHSLLETILNHQRSITGIEKDKGDKY
jgi:hypothetical protein